MPPVQRSILATAVTAVLLAAVAPAGAQGGTQPAAAAFDQLKALAGDWIDLDGGANLDPAKDGHMHSGRIEFLDGDRIRATWIGWDQGKPSAHSPVFNLERKKG